MLLMKDSHKRSNEPHGFLQFFPLHLSGSHPEFYIQHVIENDCVIHASQASSDRG